MPDNKMSTRGPSAMGSWRMVDNAPKRGPGEGARSAGYVLLPSLCSLTFKTAGLKAGNSEKNVATNFVPTHDANAPGNKDDGCVWTCKE